MRCHEIGRWRLSGPVLCTLAKAHDVLGVQKTCDIGRWSRSGPVLCTSVKATDVLGVQKRVWNMRCEKSEVSGPFLCIWLASTELDQKPQDLHENEAVPESSREKIVVPRRYRLTLAFSGLVEGVLGKLPEKISINDCLYLDTNTKTVFVRTNEQSVLIEDINGAKFDIFRI